MRPGGGEPQAAVASPSAEALGSKQAFAQHFVKAASDQFGTGWAWLVLEGDRQRVTATSNAETPLVTEQVPLLTIEVWEHAYYLDAQHRRLDYIAAFLADLVDWSRLGVSQSH